MKLIEKLKNVKDFVAIALSDYTKIAAIFPTTGFASRAVAKHIPSAPKVIVEYGAGSGSITREILRKMPPKARLISVEQNEEFLPALKDIGDSRLEIVHGDVLDVVSKLPQIAPEGVDAVVSGIPFSFMGEPLGEEVVAKTRNALKDDGRFIVYQNSARMADLLSTYFPKVKCFFEPRNLFPYFIFVASPKQPALSAKSPS